MVCFGVIVAGLTSREIPDLGESALSELRIGVLPDQDEAQLRRLYSPLIEYLVKKVGLETQLVVPSSYADLETKFAQGEIDLALLGGLTFLRLRESPGADALVMRDVDTRFTSYFVVAAGDPASSVSELAGRRLAFGSKLSTSGHLMPRYYLRKEGIEPETFFESVSYTGAHDLSALSIGQAKADIAAVNAQVVDAMLASGRLNEAEVRILWETPPYPDYVWAIRTDIQEKQRQTILDAFLSLTAR